MLNKKNRIIKESLFTTGGTFKEDQAIYFIEELKNYKPGLPRDKQEFVKTYYMFNKNKIITLKDNKFYSRLFVIKSSSKFVYKILKTQINIKDYNYIKSKLEQKEEKDNYIARELALKMSL